MDHNILKSTPCDSDLSATSASECSSDAPRLTYSEVRPRCNVNGERDNLYYKTYIGPELVMMMNQRRPLLPVLRKWTLLQRNDPAWSNWDFQVILVNRIDVCLFIQWVTNIGSKITATLYQCQFHRSQRHKNAKLVTVYWFTVVSGTIS